MENEEIEKKKAKPIERVTVAESLKDKLSRMTAQANDALQGIASVNKSDVVNLLLADHADELTPGEIEKLKLTHVDQVKYAFWIAQRLKAARDAGELLTLTDVLSQSAAIMKPTKPRATRRPRKPKQGEAKEVGRES